jgi:hypothetical protein
MINSTKGGLLLLACALSLSAANDPSNSYNLPLRFGVQVIGAFPRQTLKSAGLRTGLGIGLFAENEPYPGTNLQTWASFIRYPQANQPPRDLLADYTAPDPLTLSANSFTLGVDAHLHLPRPGLRQVFVLAGVLASRYEFQSSSVTVVADPDGQPTSQPVRRTESTPFKLGLSVGAGIDLRKDWSFILRYTHVGLPGSNLDTVETCLEYRF